MASIGENANACAMPGICDMTNSSRATTRFEEERRARVGDMYRLYSGILESTWNPMNGGAQRREPAVDTSLCVYVRVHRHLPPPPATHVSLGRLC